MRIERLVMTHFRNQRERVLEDLGGADVVALIGPNGAGKTSILEAVSVLGGGRGILSAEAKALLAWEVPKNQRAMGWGVVAGDMDGRTVAVGWKPKSDAGKKDVLVDGNRVSGDVLACEVPLVWLAPALDRLFFESLGVRREWLDDLTAALVPGHAEAVRRYTGHLRGRMKLLQTEGVEDDWLAAEEFSAARWGVKILEGRATYCEALTGFGEGVALRLEGAGLAVLDDDDRVAALAGKFARSRDIDRRMGRTMSGANTVDVVGHVVIEGGRKVALATASSGQHKRGLVGLLMAHARLVRDRLGVAPLVLIDEFGAHLDAERRAALIEDVVGLGCQVWCTDVVWAGDVAGTVRVVEISGAKEE